MGTTAFLLLLAMAFGIATGYSVRSYQHAVTRVAVEVVLTSH